MNRMGWSLLMAGLVVTAGCGRQATYRPVSAGVNGATTTTLSTPTGTVQAGHNDLQVSFTGIGDRPKDVNNPTITIRLGAASGDGFNRGPSIQQSPPLARVRDGVYRTRYDMDFSGPYQIIVSWADGGQSYSWTYATPTLIDRQPAPRQEHVGGPPAGSFGPPADSPHP